MTKEEKLARKQQRKAEKVGLGKLILWNSSSCSVALSTLMLSYATFYCTDVLQLAPALVGTLFMVSKIFDSFTDIVAGFIVDRTQTRWGKGRPYEIFMLFLWLSTWLLFSCPTSFATAAKCIWIFCMYTFMNSICVTFLNANNVVYMVRAFENKEQQSKIVGYGSIFTMVGAMVFNVLFPTAMAKVGTDAVGWSRLVGMIAIPLTAIGMLRILTIPEKFTPVSEKNGEQTHLKDLLPLLKESRPVLIICMVRFVRSIAMGFGCRHLLLAVRHRKPWNDGRCLGDHDSGIAAGFCPARTAQKIWYGRYVCHRYFGRLHRLPCNVLCRWQHGILYGGASARFCRCRAAEYDVQYVYCRCS